MSAEDILNKMDRNTWVVHGANFHCEVPMDEYNAQFDKETQAYEAASQALMAFKGLKDNLFIVMDNNDDLPALGSTMIVHLRDEPADKGFFPFTHIILANEGFHKEADEMEKYLKKRLEEERSRQDAEEKSIKKENEKKKKK